MKPGSAARIAASASVAGVVDVFMLAQAARKRASERTTANFLIGSSFGARIISRAKSARRRVRGRAKRLWSAVPWHRLGKKGGGKPPHSKGLSDRLAELRGIVRGQIGRCRRNGVVLSLHRDREAGSPDQVRVDVDRAEVALPLAEPGRVGHI